MIRKRAYALAAIACILISWSLCNHSFYVRLLLDACNIALLFAFLRIYVNTTRKTLDQATQICKLEEEKNTQSYLSETIVKHSNFNHNLANVVAGINHELSPWVGGTVNHLSRLKLSIENDDVGANKLKYIAKLELSINALDQAAKMMSVVSKNVKHLKVHSNDRANLKDTITSWSGLIFINDDIKRALEKHQIWIDYDSLNFEITHSPMLLAQVFLNLVKNTIDHNTGDLSKIQIKIYGTPDKALMIEDNGVGVTEAMLPKLFYPEVTTKTDGEIHGLGLSICKEYCKLMQAAMSAQRPSTGGLRFIIEFERKDPSDAYRIVP